MPLYIVNGRRFFVQHQTARPTGGRWVEWEATQYLVEQYPWDGPGCVACLAWCPCVLDDGSSWHWHKGRLETEAHMKRREKRNGTGGQSAFTDPEFLKKWPNVYEYLSATCYDGDPTQPRVTATLLFFGAEGCVKVCLRDRDENHCCWVAAPTLLGALGVLERELRDETAVWRLDRLAGAPEAKRVPRAKGG
jgi:hypothetical protein